MLFDIRMQSQPNSVSSINNLSTPAKRTLFRIALNVAFVGTAAVSTILILHGGSTLGHLRYFVDIGAHPLNITSIIVLVFGILTLITAISIVYATAKINRTLIVIATIVLGLCSLGLIGFSIWSFLTIANGTLSTSINNTITKELDKTQFSFVQGNHVLIDNTDTMARLEKQHKCCGFADPVDEYRTRQVAALGSQNPSSSGGNTANTNRGRGSTQQRPSTTSSSLIVQLPISCCNKQYLSDDNLCIDMFGNNTSPINRYNTEGCYRPVVQYKYNRIQKQGFITTVAACLAVISCIALAAVVRLLGEVYQIVPVRA